MKPAPAAGAVAFSDAQWSLLERLHRDFNDREAHTRLPLAIARFRDEVAKAIFQRARQFDEVVTVNVDESWQQRVAASAADPMAPYVRLYNEEVDAMMGVLVPPASYRKEHYAYGRFVFPEPHGLHTDHSLEDPAAARRADLHRAHIETLGTHYVDGDYRLQDAATRGMLSALRYWTPRSRGRAGGGLRGVAEVRHAEDHPGEPRHADGRRQRLGQRPGHPTYLRPPARRRPALGLFPAAVQVDAQQR